MLSAMRRLLFLLLFPSCVFLTGCTDTTGLSPASSKTPLGNPAASVTVTEYSDLQCPACRLIHQSVTKPLLKGIGNEVRFEFKHFPLQIHTYSLQAAQASECAADQGQFWEFIDYAYEHQAELKPENFSAWAGALKLDTELFERCVASKIKRETVLADYQQGKELGVPGTPTFFVNGERVPAELDALVTAVAQKERQFEQRL